MTAPANFVPLGGGGFVQGPLHGSPLHIDVYKDVFGETRKFHVPYEGQTTLDMFTKSSPLSDQLGRISKFNLGSFNSDKAW